MIIQLRFSFDYGGYCIWSNTGGVKHDSLPISKELKLELTNLCDAFNASMNWENPMSPSLWSKVQWTAFFDRAFKAFYKLQYELEPNYELICDLDKDKQVYMAELE